MMRKIYGMGVILAVLSLSMSTVQGAELRQAASAFVVTGVVEHGQTQKINRLVEWLAKQANVPLYADFVASYEALSAQLKGNIASIGWTCGAPYVQDHQTDGQKLVAVPLFQGKPTYHSLVISRTGRVEKTLADFEGMILAYSDPRSNSGFYVPNYHLMQQGISINKHFRHLMHTGLHEYSIEAVLAGIADVAAVDEYIWMQYIKSHPEAAANLTVLEKLGPFPFTPIVASADTPDDVLMRLQQALVSMNADAEGKVILQDCGLDGFVVQSNDFYQPIAAMLESINAAQGALDVQ